MDSESAKYHGLVESCSGSLFEQAMPLLDEYIFCRLKIRELSAKQAESPRFKEAQQIMALNAIIDENVRRLAEFMQSEGPDFVHSPQ